LESASVALFYRFLPLFTGVDERSGKSLGAEALPAPQVFHAAKASLNCSNQLPHLILVERRQAGRVFVSANPNISVFAFAYERSKPTPAETNRVMKTQPWRIGSK